LAGFANFSPPLWFAALLHTIGLDPPSFTFTGCAVRAFFKSVSVEKAGWFFALPLKRAPIVFFFPRPHEAVFIPALEILGPENSFLAGRRNPLHPRSWSASTCPFSPPSPFFVPWGCTLYGHIPAIFSLWTRKLISQFFPLVPSPSGVS